MTGRRPILLPAPVTALTATLAAAIALLASAQLAGAVFDSNASAEAQVATASLAAPGQLSAGQLSCKLTKSLEVELVWTASPSSYLASYSVERSSSAAGPFTPLASVPAGQTSYVDGASLAGGTTYYYRVSSVYRLWASPSSQVSIKVVNKGCGNL